MEEGLLAELPTQGLRPLKVSTRKRELVPFESYHQALTAFQILVFQILMSGPEQKRTATEQKRTERRSKTGFL